MAGTAKTISNIVGLTKDTRLWGAAAGVVGEALYEPLLWTNFRGLFGVLDGSAIEPSELARIRRNRNVARGASALAALAGIQYLKVRGPLAAPTQAALLAFAATATAHVIQDLVPALSRR